MATHGGWQLIRDKQRPRSFFGISLLPSAPSRRSRAGRDLARGIRQARGLINDADRNVMEVRVHRETLIIRETGSSILPGVIGS